MIIETKHILGFSYKEFAMSIIEQFLIAATMAIAVVLAQKCLLHVNQLLSFFILVLLSGVFYLGLICLWDRFTGYKMRSIVYQIFNNFVGVRA